MLTCTNSGWSLGSLQEKNNVVGLLGTAELTLMLWKQFYRVFTYLRYVLRFCWLKKVLLHKEHSVNAVMKNFTKHLITCALSFLSDFYPSLYRLDLLLQKKWYTNFCKEKMDFPSNETTKKCIAQIWPNNVSGLAFCKCSAYKIKP